MSRFYGFCRILGTFWSPCQRTFVTADGCYINGEKMHSTTTRRLCLADQSYIARWSGRSENRLSGIFKWESGGRIRGGVHSFSGGKTDWKAAQLPGKMVMPIHVWRPEKYDILKQTEKKLPFQMEYPSDGDSFEIQYQSGPAHHGSFRKT